VSLITQVFYAAVFVTRYTDLFSESWAWNYFFKVFYLLSSFYTIGIMRFVYPRTREKEIAWKLAAVILAGCLILSPFVMMIFAEHTAWSFTEVLSLLLPLLSLHPVLTRHPPVALGVLPDPGVSLRSSAASPPAPDNSADRHHLLVYRLPRLVPWAVPDQLDSPGVRHRRQAS